jgi:hemin uptake protein HemP
MTTPAPKPIPAPPPADARKTVRVTSAQLFAGAAELQIDHFGAIYRLKQTALGKLILTK